MSTRRIVPRTDGGGGLGTIVRQWGDSYFSELYEDGVRVAVQTDIPDLSGYSDTTAMNAAIAAAVDAIDIPDVSITWTVTGSNFTAADRNGYFVTPSSETTLVVTLPTTNRGTSYVRLQTSDNGRLIALNPGGSTSIEGLPNGDRVIIDRAMAMITVFWDNNANTWRLR